ncbi:TIGR03752 family integrating conjugative element protein [Aquisalimonas lutea]|uniref:TIGR03752 family integrating conjugative element protein n=1 Tax=Aquisalimonas lutea TaxID=1327750 RepID=UPI003F492B07
MHSNRLLPIIFAVVAVATVLVLLQLGGDGDQPESEAHQAMEEIPRVDRPDADTPADTIRTLAAEQSQLQEQLESLRQEKSQLENELAEQREQRQQAAEREQAAQEQRIDRFLDRIDHLSSRVEELQAQAEPSPDDEGDIPVGLGIDPADGLPADGADTSAPAPGERELTWIEPATARNRGDGRSADSGSGDGDGVLERGRDVFDAARRGGSDGAGGDSRTASSVDTEALAEKRQARRTAEVRAERGYVADVDERVAEPRYTIPRNATLMGSTTMTALIGRIPREGTVDDPAPFKVVVGDDNLAANDIDIPGIEGIIFSGTAFGDWTLSCVRGEIQSVTAVFADGTIRSLPSPDGEGDEEALGWISDDQGVPCIAGERVSNAAAFLSQATALAGAQAAGEAAAAAETTTQIGQEGFTRSIVSGDAGNFIAGRAASGAIEEVVGWLERRQQNHFDAIFAPAGQTVAVHIDRELQIDYEIDGRRVSHEAFQRDDSRVGGLD